MKKIALLMLVSFLLIGMNNTAKAGSDVELLGAGATFPYPLYSKMFDQYHKETGAKVNYQAIGSGGGIRQVISKTVDFGGTDAFMNKKELKKTNNSIVHIPTCLGAVAITYNLPGNPKLKMTSKVIADIFLGKIKKWNDKKIKKLNPKVKLPSLAISVVHRSDGSGTTFIFSDYLTKVSKTWKKKVGRGKALKWPVGLGGKGNQGVAGLIKQVPGACGYVELIYAQSNKMPVALVKNKSGNYIKPTIKSVSLAANVKIPTDTRVSLTNTAAKKGYPLSSFTWIIVHNELNFKGRSKKQAQEIVKLLDWMIHKGQKYAKPLHYAPLPEKAVKAAEKQLQLIKYKGKSLLK